MTRIELITDSSEETKPSQKKNIPIDENIFDSSEFIITNNNRQEYDENLIRKEFEEDQKLKKNQNLDKENLSPETNYDENQYAYNDPYGDESNQQNFQDSTSKRKWDIADLELGGVKLTVQLIKQLCKQHNLFQTPHLNDKLYLHHKGFRTVDTGALNDYISLKALWLEGNALKNLNGIDHLKELRCLYAHQNLLEDISALHAMSDLRTLNLSQNRLSEIPLDTLSKWCPKLSNLNLSQNRFSTADSILEVTRLEELSVFDIQDNKIDDEGIIEHIVNMKSLSVLYLKGNSVVNKIKSYRKTLISKINNLKYLDDRPVFEDERRLALAYVAGGIKGEQEERKLMNQEKKDKDKKDLQNFREWQKNARVRRLQHDLEDKMKNRIAQLVRSYQFNFESIAKVINDEFRNIDPQTFTELPVTDPDFEMEPYKDIDAEKCRELFVNWKNYPYEKRQIPPTWSVELRKEYEDAQEQSKQNNV